MQQKKKNNMKTKNNLQILLFIALVIIILSSKVCSFDKNIKPAETITVTETLISYDTINDTISEYIPKWKTKIEIDTFYAPVDTMAVLKDYYAKYLYVDTIKIDTIGYLVVKDSITENKILSRNIKTNILLPVTTITSTTTTYINKIDFYVGLKAQGTSNQLNYIGGEFLLKGKKRKAYSLGVGLNNELKPVVSGGIYFKLSK